MSIVVFGTTPPAPKKCLTCKSPRWHWNGKDYDCLNCYKGNPCVLLYGPGAEGKQCQDCVHLHGFKQSATWYKCDLRQWKSKGGKNQGTMYPGGDHRVHWPACARFEPIQEARS